MIRIFRVFVPTTVLALIVSEIFLLYFCFVVGTFLAMEVDPTFFLLEENGLLRISFVVVSIIAAFYFQDLYTNLRIRSRLMLLQQIALALGIAFLVQALLTYVNPVLMLPRWLMMYAGFGATILLAIWRLFFTRVLMGAFSSGDVLLIGTSQVMAESAEFLKNNPEFGFRMLGYLDDNSGNRMPAGLERLGTVAELKSVVEAKRPSRLVVGMAERRGSLPVYELLDLRLSGIHVEDTASLYETSFGRVSVRDLRPSQLVFSSQMGPSPTSVTLQSVYSFLLALVGAVITSPLMLVAAILVKVTSPGPILHRQTRVGQDDKPFTVYKFRSMRADAEAKTGAVWASKNDPRITSVGKYLRKFRIDELPQFWNVLRGEMSFVGPRPERPEFVKALSEKIPFYRQRHCVKPGITGWAQINHKYGDSIEDTITKLEYDLYYIKHLSPSLDLYIVFNTLKTVMLGRGAQ